MKTNRKLFSDKRIRGVRLEDLRNPTNWSDPRSHQWSRGTDPRKGVSVVGSWDDLARYFSRAGGRPRVYPDQIHNSQVVWVEGVLSPEEDHDADAPGSPFLLIDPKPVSRRPLRPEEVVELVWYDAPAQDLWNLASRLRELTEIYPRETAERLLSVTSYSTVEGPFDLSNLMTNPDGSEVVTARRKNALMWNNFIEDWDVVPTEDVLKDTFRRSSRWFGDANGLTCVRCRSLLH